LVKEFVSKAIKITWVIFLGKEKYRSTDTLGKYHPLDGYSFYDVLLTDTFLAMVDTFSPLDTLPLSRYLLLIHIVPP